MEILIAYFVQFSCALTMFLFLERRMSTLNFKTFLKYPHFLRSLRSSVVRQMVR